MSADDDDTLFATWFFRRLTVVHMVLYLGAFAVYCLCVSGEAGLRWRDGLVAVFYLLTLAARLLVHRHPEQRRKGVAFLLAIFPCTCLVHTFVSAVSPLELTRVRLMAMHWGGFQEPFRMMPAVLSLGFVCVGLSTSQLAFAFPRYYTAAVVAPTVSIVLTLGHAYYLTAEPAAIELVVLALLSFWVGCGIGWRGATLSHRVWFSAMEIERMETKLKAEAKEAERHRNRLAAEARLLHAQVEHLREETVRAAAMAKIQAHRRLNAEALLRRVSRPVSSPYLESHRRPTKTSGSL